VCGCKTVFVTVCGWGGGWYDKTCVGRARSLSEGLCPGNCDFPTISVGHHVSGVVNQDARSWQRGAPVSRYNDSFL
jgi:hypothetical protein